MCTAWEVGRADDDALLALLRSGCDNALGEMERRYGPRLRGQADRLLRDTPYDPDDAVQDTLLRVWTRLRTGGGDPQLGPWLAAVVRNRSIDLLRSAAAQRAALALVESESSRDVVDEVLGRELLREVTSGLAALPPRQREALVRHAWGGESHSAIAGSLGTSPESARALVHRARRAVRA